MNSPGLNPEFTIELTCEVDGRWIADVPDLNILLYGSSRNEAIEKAQSAAREIISDRIARGELADEFAPGNRRPRIATA